MIWTYHLCSKLRWFDSCSHSSYTRLRKIWGRSPTSGSPSAGQCRLWPVSECLSWRDASRRGTSGRDSAAPRKRSWCSASSSSPGCWRRAAALCRDDGAPAGAPCAWSPPGTCPQSGSRPLRMHPRRENAPPGRWKSAARPGTWSDCRTTTRATAVPWLCCSPAGSCPAGSGAGSFGPFVPKMQNPRCHPDRNQTVYPPCQKQSAWPLRNLRCALVMDNRMLTDQLVAHNLPCNSPVGTSHGLNTSRAPVSLGGSLGPILKTERDLLRTLYPSLWIVHCLKNNYKRISRSPNHKCGENTCPIINFLPSSPANIDKPLRI